MGLTSNDSNNYPMNRYYGIFSSRGLWVEVVKGAKGGTKRVVLTGREEAEKRAHELSTEHKRKYWVEEVKLSAKSI
jgi:hypothetical protein